MGVPGALWRARERYCSDLGPVVHPTSVHTHSLFTSTFRQRRDVRKSNMKLCGIIGDMNLYIRGVCLATDLICIRYLPRIVKGVISHTAIINYFWKKCKATEFLWTPNRNKATKKSCCFPVVFPFLTRQEVPSSCSVSFHFLVEFRGQSCTWILIGQEKLLTYT